MLEWVKEQAPYLVVLGEKNGLVSQRLFGLSGGERVKNSCCFSEA